MSEIVIEGDGKFPTDVRVPIVDACFREDGTATITARGTHRGRSVGLEITVQGRMKPGLIEAEIDRTAFYPEGIIIRSIGNPIRCLADVFSEVYTIPVVNAEQLDQLDLTSFALDGDPTLIETEHLNLKVFHDDEDSLGLYFEMFLHIDIPEGYVRLD
ncbi:MAG: hypothetical protein ACXVK3_08650, partial [Candidatus Angelobacter sp.]